MAQDISLLGATYEGVPAVQLPKSGGGTARFDDASVTTAVAADVAAGKLFLAADGTITTGTSSGGGGIGTLIKTQSLGHLTTTSTSEVDTGKTITVTGINDYDALLYVLSTDVQANGHLIGELCMITLAATSNVHTKSGNTVATAKLYFKKSNSGVITSSGVSAAYGVYPKSGTISSGSLTLPLYMKYSSTYSSTIDGDFTVDIYGVSICDLLGI